MEALLAEAVQRFEYPAQRRRKEGEELPSPSHATTPRRSVLILMELT